MTAIDPRFYLITPVLTDVEPFRPKLTAAAATGEVMAVLLRLAPADERTLVNRVKALAPAAQAYDVAVIVADPVGATTPLDLAAVVTRGGADGAHATDPTRLEELGTRLKNERNIGAGNLRSKHDAMVAGELGVDYVLFGEPRPDDSLPAIEFVEERATWWAEIFQTPCVVFAPSLESVSRLAATGAEFVGLGDYVWSHQGGPAAAIAQARQALETRPEQALS